MHEAVSNDDYAELQRQLVRHPDQCDPPERRGAARKVRMAVWGKGKSGGARVIYRYHDSTLARASRLDPM